MFAFLCYPLMILFTNSSHTVRKNSPSQFRQREVYCGLLILKKFIVNADLRGKTLICPVSQMKYHMLMCFNAGAMFCQLPYSQHQAAQNGHSMDTIVLILQMEFSSPYLLKKRGKNQDPILILTLSLKLLENWISLFSTNSVEIVLTFGINNLSLWLPRASCSG